MVAVRKGRSFMEPVLGRYTALRPAPARRIATVGDIDYLTGVLGYNMSRQVPWRHKHVVSTPCGTACQYADCAARLRVILDAAKTQLADVKLCRTAPSYTRMGEADRQQRRLEREVALLGAQHARLTGALEYLGSTCS